MRIFLTGATGFVGSAIIAEFLQHGHSILGLARSEKGADALRGAGAEPIHGSLEDLDVLRRGAESTDATIHCGFIHDFSNFEKSCAVDRAAIETIGNALAGTHRPFLITSGLAGIRTDGQPATENDNAAADAFIRFASEGVAKSFAAKGVRPGVVRLSPSVHDQGDHGFVPMLINVARQKGFAAYIGEGANRWPGVHRRDAAALYRLAIEKGEAGWSYHAVADEGVPTREIAEAIGQGLGLPVRSIAPQDAAAHFDWMSRFFAMDFSATSALTQERLGWKPAHPGLLADIAENYFVS